MRTPSLEYFYHKINKHISLTSAFTGDKDLEFIIKSCRLKPIEILTLQNALTVFNAKIILSRHWFDEFGNSLKIIKSKRLRIILNDLSLDRSRIISTDMYNGLSIDKIVKISKFVFIFHGENHFILSFLGLDNYLRSFFFDEEWKTIPSLYLGLRYLKCISKNKDIKYYKKIFIKDDIIYPCLNQEVWLSCLPAHENFINIFSENENISNILKG